MTLFDGSATFNYFTVIKLYVRCELIRNNTIQSLLDRYVYLPDYIGVVHGYELRNCSFLIISDGNLDFVENNEFIIIHCDQESLQEENQIFSRYNVDYSSIYFVNKYWKGVLDKQFAKNYIAKRFAKT